MKEGDGMVRESGEKWLFSQNDLRNHLGASECLKKVKDEEAWNFKVITIFHYFTIKNIFVLCSVPSSSSQVWVANDDREVEGKFENW